MLFSSYCISLFYKSICNHEFLHGRCIYLKGSLWTIYCVCTMYFTDVSISSVLLFHRSRYGHKFWVVLSLFQESTYSDLQSCSECFDTSWWLRKFSFHHNSNEALLLVINWYIPLASRVAKQLKTEGLRKLGNIRKNLKTSELLRST